MSYYFTPYSGSKPVKLLVNGHNIIILSPEKQVIEESLMLLGADKIKKINTGETQEDEAKAFVRLGQKTNCGIVVIPHHVELKEALKDLENNLPWLQ